MPWGLGPQPPTAGTTITVAWAQSNVVDLLNWLRALTGGADPPGANYVPVSISPAAASWQKIPDAALADAKISKTNIGGVGGPNAQLLTSFYESLAGEGGQPYSANWLFLNLRQGNLAAWHASQMAWDIGSNTGPWTRQISGGIAATWARIWTSENDGPGSGLNADLLDGLEGAQYAPIAGAVPSGLIAAFGTAAAIPAGWSRFANGNGKLLVGAGTSFGQAFIEGASAGTSWDHLHGVSLSSGGPTPAGGPVTGGGTSSAAPDTHTHASSGNSANFRWLPPSFTVVWAQKS